MLAKIYYWLHRITSKPQERGEYSSGYWSDRVRRDALALLEGIEGEVLEVGCGEGLFLVPLAAEHPGLRISGIDNNLERLAQAKNRVAKAGLSTISLFHQDATNLVFEDGHFDAVVCIGVLFNLDSINCARQVLSSMSRVCKKGGRIIFEYRNSLNPLFFVKYGLARYYDKTLTVPLTAYSPRQIAAIAKSLDLKIIRERYIGFRYKLLSPVIIVEARKS
jgi:ubiquinone/menaquinone biosynthesis C-methylase UbiE